MMNTLNHHAGNHVDELVDDPYHELLDQLHDHHGYAALDALTDEPQVDSVDGRGYGAATALDSAVIAASI
jgi:hypothetical protein